MADVTINNLPDLAVTGTNHLVHTNGTTTGKATINTLRAALNIPAAQVNSDWNVVSGVAQILNKPTQFGLTGVFLKDSWAPGNTGTYTTPANTRTLLIICVGSGGASSSPNGTCGQPCCNAGASGDSTSFGPVVATGGAQGGGGNGTGNGNIYNSGQGFLYKGIGAPSVSFSKGPCGRAPAVGCTCAGGSSGGTAVHLINSPSSTYSFSVGRSGNNTGFLAVLAFA